MKHFYVDTMHVTSVYISLVKASHTATSNRHGVRMNNLPPPPCAWKKGEPTICELPYFSLQQGKNEAMCEQEIAYWKGKYSGRCSAKSQPTLN